MDTNTVTTQIFSVMKETLVEYVVDVKLAVTEEFDDETIAANEILRKTIGRDKS